MVGHCLILSLLQLCHSAHFLHRIQDCSGVKNFLSARVVFVHLRASSIHESVGSKGQPCPSFSQYQHPWDGIAWHGAARTKVIPLEVDAVVQLAPVGSAPIFMSRNSTSTLSSPSAGCRGHECRDSSVLSSLLRMGANKRLTVHVGISPLALLCHVLRSEHLWGSHPALA